jgi:hypothetical protein
MKEDDEGIRFHSLLTAGMHRGGRILPEKRRRRVCSSCSGRQRFFLWRGNLGDAGGGKQGRGKARRREKGRAKARRGGDSVLVARKGSQTDGAPGGGKGTGVGGWALELEVQAQGHAVAGGTGEGRATAALAAGTRGDAEGGYRGASSRESWGRLGPVTCGAGFSGGELHYGV